MTGSSLRYLVKEGFRNTWSNRMNRDKITVRMPSTRNQAAPYITFLALQKMMISTTPEISITTPRSIASVARAAPLHTRHMIPAMIRSTPATPHNTR